MEYRTLGRSGCAVSALCLGTMTFGSESERIIGGWLASRPADATEGIVLATKGRFPTAADPNGAGLSARHLTGALDASLGRLRVETVDLYQAHAWDPVTPLEETLQAMDGFVRAGKIRFFDVTAST